MLLLKEKSTKYLKYFKNIEWEKVCRIKSHGREFGIPQWYYEDIDEDLMFSSHRSWIYAITVNGKIFKLGETGNPLGIRGSWSYDSREWEDQPKHGSTNRLGRYRKGDASDETIRYQLAEFTRDPSVLVEFWAYPCAEIIEKKVINGHEIEIKAQVHKSFEKSLINLYINLNEEYPPGNTGRY